MNNIKIPITKVKVRDAADMYEIMRVVLEGENKINMKQEHCWVIALNYNQKIMNIELIGIGSVHEVIVRPMEVLSIPLQKSAKNIVIIHNHPSGSLQASEGDIDVTDRMTWACKIMQIKLLDHMIITESSYFSFEESGLMNKIKENTNYVVPYIVQDEARKKADLKFKEKMMKVTEKHGKEILKAMDSKANAIAKTMHDMGMKLEDIVKATGLSIKEVNSLIKKLIKK